MGQNLLYTTTCVVAAAAAAVAASILNTTDVSTAKAVTSALLLPVEILPRVMYGN